MIYKAKEGSHISDKDAAIAGPILDYLMRGKGATPDDVVNMAEPEDAELHNFFTWDNEICGVKWRKQEARLLINAIVTIDGDREFARYESIPVIEYVSEEEGSMAVGRVYRLTTDILSNPSDWELMKIEIRQSLNAIRRKLRSYEDFVTEAQTQAVELTLSAFDK